MADAAVDQLENGSGAGLLQLYSGSKPANPGDTPAGNLLAEFTLDDPAFGDAASGSADAAGLPKTTQGTTAAGTGTTVGFARAADSAGNGLWDDDDVGTSGNNITLSNTEIADGQDVTLNSWSWTQPAE